MRGSFSAGSYRPRRWLLPAALAFVSACGGPPAPVNVPGPTIARPEDLKPAAPPAPAPSTGPARVALRSPDSRVVALRVVFAAGSADDPVGKEGITQLVASAMAEGGTSSLSYAELATKLYPLAGSIDAHVDRDETVFSATVPAAVLDRFYPLFREVLLSPRFDADSFARLRARQLSELTSELRGSNDEELGKEALQTLLYDGHPYGHPVQGTERGLAAIALDDLRAQYARVLCRDRVVIGVAGGYPAGFDDTLVADLSHLPACAGERAKLPEPPERSGNELLVVDKPGASATAISIGFTTPVTRAEVADYPGLLFAADALGIHRQSSGRLFQELREKRGLNYGDYAYAEFFQQESHGRAARPNIARRQQFVSLWLRPVKHANAPFALRAGLEVFSKFVADGMSETDFARTREFLSRQIGLDQQTPSRRLGFAIDDQTYRLDKPYIDVLRESWKALDPAKLKALAARLLATKNLAIAIVSSDGAAVAGELLKAETVASATPAYDAPKPAEVQAEDKEIARFPIPLDPKRVRVVPASEMFK
jgi:zinc protease